jgi:DNA-binding transcriptional MerR regulator
MTTTIYGTIEAAKRLGLNPKRLRRWLDFGYYETDYRAVLGKGEYRLFSDPDIAVLKEILGKIEAGVPVGRAFGKGGS